MADSGKSSRQTINLDLIRPRKYREQFLPQTYLFQMMLS